MPSDSSACRETMYSSSSTSHMSLKSAPRIASSRRRPAGEVLLWFGLGALPSGGRCGPTGSVFVSMLDGGRRKRVGDRSRWPLGYTEHVDAQQVQAHQNQQQPHEDLLHPQTRVQLLLQPRVAGHHSHELGR